MRLDHVSYVASHDQISDVVNRIGSQIGTAFVDGGIHPKFGTRNFTAPLLNGQYIEIVCPLDHPATDTTPFGQAVKKKADAGGGWLAWVISTDDMDSIEELFARKSISAHRRKPDGEDLLWNQIGVSDLIERPIRPFFIQWLAGVHPSSDGHANSSLVDIKINVQDEAEEELLKLVLEKGENSFSKQLNFINSKHEEVGIVSVKFKSFDKEQEVF
jgi:hypothetical protein